MILEETIVKEYQILSFQVKGKEIKSGFEGSRGQENIYSFFHLNP
jgi:hypothetical protein